MPLLQARDDCLQLCPAMPPGEQLQHLPVFPRRLPLLLSRPDSRYLVCPIYQAQRILCVVQEARRVHPRLYALHVLRHRPRVMRHVVRRATEQRPQLIEWPKAARLFPRCLGRLLQRCQTAPPVSPPARATARVAREVVTVLRLPAREKRIGPGADAPREPLRQACIAPRI